MSEDLPDNASANVDLAESGGLQFRAPKVIPGAQRGALALRLRSLGLGACLLAGLLLGLLAGAPAAQAQVHVHPDENGSTVVRSLESLRDLDYQSWQAVAYRSGPPGGPVTLRLVGYPGKLRLDHPTSLVVYGGRRRWQLDDITTANPKLAADGRDAAAEFNLSPLLADLRKNRPLRLELPGVFVELPVPPFVVAEWRSLPSWREADATRS